MLFLRRLLLLLCILKTKTFLATCEEDLITLDKEGNLVKVSKNRGRNIQLDTYQKLEKPTGFIHSPLRKVVPGTWPWAVSVGVIKDTGSWLHYCSGVIVSDSHVLTTRNCVGNLKFQEPNNTKIFVRAGDINLKFDRENRLSFIQELEVIKHVFHHELNVAVLKLDSSFNVSTIYVRPVDLPHFDELESGLKEDSGLVVIGYKDQELKDSIVSSFSTKYCNSTELVDFYGPIFTKDFKCAGSPLTLAGSCEGEDGSALVKLDDKRWRYVLAGIQRMVDIEDCGSRRFPNTFTTIMSEGLLQFIWKEVHNITKTLPQNEHGSVSLIHSQYLKKEQEHECGINSVQNEDDTATVMLGRWPWQVSLQKQDYGTNNYNHFCGGSILTPTKILTAAHCIFSRSGAQLRPESIKVRAGDVILKDSNNDDDAQFITVQKLDVHPKYKWINKNRYFDVAILSLASNLTFNDFVRPVCLLSQDEAKMITKNDETSMPLAVSGWGAGDALENIVAVVHSDALCNKTHINKKDNQNLVPNLFTEDLMCAGDPAGESGTCSGDSGGGAVHFDSSKRQYILRGVVSGSAHSQCGSYYFPNVYVRMASVQVLGWVYQMMSFTRPGEVFIEVKPQVPIQPGSHVQYQCSSKRTMPNIELSWNIKGQHENKTLFTVNSTKNVTHVTSMVTFTSPTESIFVTVECIAVNSVGRISTTVTDEMSRGWTQWGAWSECNVSCGGGRREKRRYCNNPLQKNSDVLCSGSPKMTEECNIQDCYSCIDNLPVENHGEWTCHRDLMKSQQFCKLQCQFGFASTTFKCLANNGQTCASVFRWGKSAYYTSCAGNDAGFDWCATSVDPKTYKYKKWKKCNRNDCKIGKLE